MRRASLLLHGNILVNTHAGIESPVDLAGKGIPRWRTG